jgi:hypothetical protein
LDLTDVRFPLIDFMGQSPRDEVFRVFSRRSVQVIEHVFARPHRDAGLVRLSHFETEKYKAEGIRGYAAESGPYARIVSARQNRMQVFCFVEKL